jgi:hypothetical protein
VDWLIIISALVLDGVPKKLLAFFAEELFIMKEDPCHYDFYVILWNLCLQQEEESQENMLSRQQYDQSRKNGVN